MTLTHVPSLHKYASFQSNQSTQHTIQNRDLLRHGLGLRYTMLPCRWIRDFSLLSLYLCIWQDLTKMWKSDMDKYSSEFEQTPNSALKISSENMLVHLFRHVCDWNLFLSLSCCLFTFLYNKCIPILFSAFSFLSPHFLCFHLLSPSSHLFRLLMHMDIIKSWSSFNIHLHNRTSTLSVAALRGRGCVIGSDYLPEDDTGLGRHLQLFIHNASTETQMHFIVSFCILFYP